MEIALFGGTFDPPTLAHEAIIDTILARKDIDELWVMPSASRRDKPDMTDEQTRLRMLRQLKKESFNDNPRVKISTFEIDLPYATETYKTYDALKRVYPNDTFMFVYGADSYGDMPNWRHGKRLQRTMGMLLVDRVGYTLPEESATIRHLRVPAAIKLHTSSTEVRTAVSDGQDYADLVSKSVAAFILSNDLYRQSTMDVCKL